MSTARSVLDSIALNLVPIAPRGNDGDDALRQLLTDTPTGITLSVQYGIPAETAGTRMKLAVEFRLNDIKVRRLT